MKITVFWVVAPCRLIALMMEALSTFETWVNFYQTTRATTQKCFKIQLKGITLQLNEY
jgi:hypothetical protein